MSSQPDLGVRIAELRRRIGMSQSQLAGTDLTASYISLIEAGKRDPHIRVVNLLAQRLRCTPEYLLSGVEADDQERAELDLRYAELARRSGDLAEALRRFEDLLDSPAIAAMHKRPDVMLGIARCLEGMRRLDEAAARFEELRSLAADDPTVPTWWPATLGLCTCHRLMGDVAFAVEIGESAMAKLRAADLLDTDMGIEVVATLAAAYWDRGDIGRANILLEEARERADRAGSRTARGAAYWNASIAAQMQDRIGDALVFAERALALIAEDDNDRWDAQLRVVRGWLLLRADPPAPADALAVLEDAAQRLRALGREVDLGPCEIEIARAHLLLGDPHRAVDVAMTALARLSGSQPLHAADARSVVAAAQHALGNREAARQTFSAAVHDLESVGASRQAASAWVELATLAESVGDHTGAIEAYRHATAAAGVRPTASQPLVAVPSGVPTLGGQAGPADATTSDDVEVVEVASSHIAGTH